MSMQTFTQSHSSGGAGEGSAGGSFVHDQGVDSGEPVKRKRGRPRKKAETPLSPSGKPLVTTGEVISGEPVKRKRGRPRNDKPVSDASPCNVPTGEGSAGGSFVNDQGVISGEPVKRKRGRPRKDKPVLDASPCNVPTGEGSAGGSFVNDQGVISGELVKRKRGRPRNDKPVSDASPRSVSTSEGSAGDSFVHDQGVNSGSGGSEFTPPIITDSEGEVNSGEPVKVKHKRRRPRKEVPLEGPVRYYDNNRRGLLNKLCASDEDRQNAHDRAEELQSGLDPDIPSFVKPMLQSHVSGEFWLDLPVEFCKTYMPNHNETIITMVNKKGQVFLTKYLALKTGLSAGWRGFVIQHDLVDGDVLVFQMIKPTRFNVYIIKVNQSLKKINSSQEPKTTLS